MSEYDSEECSEDEEECSEDEEEFCTRCGRDGHDNSSCYAKKNIDGGVIEEDEDEEVIEEDEDEEVIEEDEDEDEEDDCPGVYVLKLNNGKYYVGKSETSVKNRLKHHFSGNGSEWTKLHGIIGKIDTSTVPMDDIESWERAETLHVALKYGIENVRGHQFTRIVLRDSDINDFEKQVCERKDLCRRCGRNGHMISRCVSHTRTNWMSGDKNLSFKRQKKN